MKLLFENWRKFALVESEEQSLIIKLFHILHTKYLMKFNYKIKLPYPP